MALYPEFADIKQFYDWKCYTDSDIRTYVEIDWITSEQYEEIVGKPYENNESKGE
ncbi:XkdX family protein [Bacillus atrophaeus]|uniref:XkdX family protein n=1 Tax=Bacillus atrophaeus TaxID=1452 RepID=UPI00227FC3BF|nr:XkdX family protein [Bacillus atrophaeus]MCY8911032.1 XkdX family protein [Bacillus atrophaeus]MCY8940653.1 XkdX family protein [Bacillus atrophaeus]MEC0837883.1 XkdX family protein [Bacillus atrophaeus]MEC0847318.1 XkdX family protein [Bacillus atrophaeus]MEC0849814.1 XkdX family protein [Bacillus atrophaeus]